MFLYLFVVVIGCLIDTVRSDLPYCEVWPDHKNFGLLHSEDDCGQVKVEKEEISTRIAHGRSVTRGHYPWMAYLTIQHDKKSSFCGGSVINSRYILTAAHCVDKKNPVVTVQLGLHNRHAPDHYTEIYNVERIIKHFDHKVYAGKNDIALLRVQKNISFKSPYINYVCMPIQCSVASSTLIGQKAALTGWGRIRDGKFDRTLRSMNVQVVKCPSYKLKNRKRTSADETQMCTKDRKSEACHGDSGGPLVVKSQSRAVQVGVFSFGQVNCYTKQSDETDYYVNVTNYIEWILDNIEP